MNNFALLIFLISSLAVAFFVVRLIIAGAKKDKAQLKKQGKMAGLSVAVMFVSLIVFAVTMDTTEVAVEKKPRKIETSAPVVKKKPAEETTDDSEVESVTEPERENIIGKSDKDFKKVTKTKPGKVRNDTTGKWKKTRISENVDIEQYALSYANLYMAEGDVHYIINFNHNTTTQINKMNSLLYVDVKEYVDKEEHDAEKIGSGMLLKSYIIYPGGDIQEVE